MLQADCEEVNFVVKLNMGGVLFSSITESKILYTKRGEVMDIWMSAVPTPKIPQKFQFLFI